jgi:ribosomal protein S20
MPITSSAKKAIRAAKHKRVFNLRHKSQIDKSLKAFRAMIAAKDKAGASKLIPSIYKSLDKAAKVGFIKPNASARLKSRAMAALKKLG